MAARDDNYKRNFSIFDFEKSTYGHYTQLMTLFNILKQRINGRFGFWGNRAMIASDTNKLIIAIDETTRVDISPFDEVPNQIGFCFSTYNEETHTVTIVLIESFEQRCGIATFMLDYLSKKHSKGHTSKPIILIDDPLPDSLPFWDAYFRHNKCAGMLEWCVDGKGRGPFLTFTKPISYANFVKLMDDIKTATNSGLVKPKMSTWGGIEIENYEQTKTEVVFSFPPNRFIWPRFEDDWREKWAQKDDILFPKYLAFKTSLKFEAGFFEIEVDLNILKGVFEKYGIKVKFICV